VIVAPYDTRLSSHSSSMTCFYVEPNAAAVSGGVPKRVTYVTHSLPPPSYSRNNANADEHAKRVVRLPRQAAVALQKRTPLTELPPDARRYWEEQLRMTCRTLCALVHYYKHDRRRTQLKAAWRKKPKGAGAGAGASATPCSKLEKLARSVRSRLVEAFSPERVDPLLAAVVECIETTWTGKA